MRLRTLTAIASFVWIPAVQAYTTVWFETPSFISNLPGSLPAGGPGQTLNLICDSTLNGTCTWQIQMRAALGTGGIMGWSLDLRTSPGNGVSILNPQIVPGPFNNSAFAGTGGSGPALLFGAHGQTFSPPPVQTLTLMTFTLRRSITTGDMSLATILGGPSLDGTIVWANNSTGDYEVVQFGPNPPVLAIEGAIGAIPLITMNSPEPTSFSLLALGIVVCLQRRSPNTKSSLI